MPFKLEIACFTLDSAVKASFAGADRIELCEDYDKGGVTPSKEIIKQAKKSITIPIHVIIRPRGGDFFYSESEIQQMENDVAFCKEQKIDGVVIGILNTNKTIDQKNCQRLISLARPMKITFHRAIDECRDMEREMETLIELGIDYVLSSGGKNSVMEGLQTLKILQEKFKSKITIIPAGGIRSSNLESIIEETNCKEFHSAAIMGEFSVKEINGLKNIILSR